MFFKIDLLKNFAIFTGKRLCWGLCLIKLQDQAPAKRIQHRCFPVNIARFLRTTFFTEASRGCFYYYNPSFKTSSSFVYVCLLLAMCVFQSNLQTWIILETKYEIFFVISLVPRTIFVFYNFNLIRQEKVIGTQFG